MPLAFDLISTLVMGSIFPVATTDRAIVPRSTVASLDSGIFAGPPKYADPPHPITARPRTATPPYTARFLDFVMSTHYQTDEHFEMLQRITRNSAQR